MLLNKLLDHLKPLGYPLRPFGTETIENCIVYNLVPLTGDGVKEQSRLEITVISRGMQEGLAILEQIKSVLLTLGDEPLTSGILSVALNGGGSLENWETGTYHCKAFFIVVSKYRRE